MESSGIFYKGEESLKAPTHTLFGDGILRPLNSDDLRLLMEVCEPTTGTGVGHVLSSIEALST
eukprot:568100-Prorocentrum_lima.AAC.1